MALRLTSGSLTSSQRLQEAVGRLHVDQVDVELAAERVLHLLGLARPHEAGVDEHARELVADGLVDEGGGHRRVDPARQPAQHPLAAHLGPDLVHLGLDDRRHGPPGGTPAHVVEEVLEHLLAPGGMGHLGVELDAVDPPVGVLQGRHRDHVGAGGHPEPGRRLHDRVAVAHPHVLGDGQVGEQGGAGDDLEARPAVLGHIGAGDQAPELLRHQLGAVADAQDGDSGVVDRGIEGRRSVDVDRRRPPAEDDPGRLSSEELVEWDVAGDDLAVDVGFADAPGDELGVLRPEIDDQNRLVQEDRVPAPVRDMVEGPTSAPLPGSGPPGGRFGQIEMSRNGLAPVTSTYSVPPLPQTLILKVKLPASSWDSSTVKVMTFSPWAPRSPVVSDSDDPRLGEGRPLHGLVADVGDGDRPAVHARLQVDRVGVDGQGGGEGLDRGLGLLDIGRVARLVDLDAGLFGLRRLGDRRRLGGLSHVGLVDVTVDGGLGGAAADGALVGATVERDPDRPAATGVGPGRTRTGQAEDQADDGHACRGHDPARLRPAGGRTGGRRRRCRRCGAGRWWCRRWSWRAPWG